MIQHVSVYRFISLIKTSLLTVHSLIRAVLSHCLRKPNLSHCSWFTFNCWNMGWTTVKQSHKKCNVFVLRLALTVYNLWWDISHYISSNIQIKYCICFCIIYTNSPSYRPTCIVVWGHLEWGQQFKVHFYEFERCLFGLKRLNVCILHDTWQFITVYYGVFWNVKFSKTPCELLESSDESSQSVVPGGIMEQKIVLWPVLKSKTVA